MFGVFYLLLQVENTDLVVDGKTLIHARTWLHIMLDFKLRTEVFGNFNVRKSVLFTLEGISLSLNHVQFLLLSGRSIIGWLRLFQNFNGGASLQLFLIGLVIVSRPLASIFVRVLPTVFTDSLTVLSIHGLHLLPYFLQFLFLSKCFILTNVF